MALAHRATGAVAGADSGNLVVTLPANQLNDIITIEVVQHDNVASTIAGYTLIGSQTNGASMTTRVFGKRSNGAESNPTITHAAGAQIIACATVHSGVDAGLTIGVGAGSVYRDIQFTTGSSVGAGTFSLTAPALSGVVSGDMRIFMGASDQTDTSGGGTTNNATPPAGFSERIDNGRTNATNSQLEIADLLASGSAGSLSSTWNAQAFNNPSWIGAQLALSSDVVATTTLPTPPLPRAFQEKGGIYSGECTGFQPLAFQIPDPTRAFQENDAFQPQAFQKPDPTVAFQPEAFDDGSSFQMSVLAFQEPTGFQGDAFQESAGQVAAGATTVSGVGAIASAEAWGTTRVVRIEGPTGTASTEAFGTTGTVRIIANSGAIATATAFGTTRAVRFLGPTGLSSSEAWGTTRAVRYTGPSAIGSSIAFGTPAADRLIGPTGISSSTAFGAVQHVIRLIGPLGIASSEAWGKPTETGGIYSNVVTVSGVGAISSAEVFGITRAVRIEGPTGLSSTTAFGTTRSVFIVGPSGFSSGAFGTPDALRFVGPSGIASGQALGTTHAYRLLQNAGAIASTTGFGTTRSVRVLLTLGIGSAQAFGTPTKSPQIVSPRGIASSEAFGTPIYVGPVLFGSVFGSVFLSDVSVYDVNTDSVARFEATVDDTARFGSDSLTTSVYDAGVDDLGRFSASADDTPGG